MQGPPIAGQSCRDAFVLVPPDPSLGEVLSRSALTVNQFKQ
jgi:hypothetical protein